MGSVMADAEAEYEAAQAMEMVEQTAVHDSILDEVYVEANRQFIGIKQAVMEALFIELDGKAEVEEGPESSQAQELPHFPIYLAPGKETVNISNNSSFSYVRST